MALPASSARRYLVSGGKKAKSLVRETRRLILSTARGAAALGLILGTLALAIFAGSAVRIGSAAAETAAAAAKENGA